jgi:serine protease Do
MTGRHAVSLACLAALLAAGLAVAAPPETAPPKGVPPADFRSIVRGATTKVFPAVVYVRCIRETHAGGKRTTEEISGSGVIVSPKGELITNWHVIDKAVEVRCLLHDGTALRAEVLGSDKDTDLALVRLVRPEDAPPLPHAELGDSSALVEGDFVMAMGAPWGLARSVSIGIVSCTRRYLPDTSEYSLWIQTDAAISPGNSGGPLVDTKGRVIGINTRTVMQGGDMGFAIPSETVRLIADSIRAHGRVQWSWTGLQLQPLRDFNRNIVFDHDSGVMVAGTDPESPARRAGLTPRDRILEVNGRPITARTEEDMPAVWRLLGTLPLGKPATLKIDRAGKALEIALTPREKGDVEGEELACPRWDFSVKTINQFDNPDLYFHRKTGVFVYGVKYPGNASDAGLSRSDILLKIDGKPVATLDDVRKIHEAALEQIDKKHRVVVTVLRNGLLCQIVLDFLRDYEKE